MSYNNLQRELINKKAKQFGLSYDTVRKVYQRVVQGSFDTEESFIGFEDEFDKKLQEACDRRNRKVETLKCPVVVVRNAMFLAMLTKDWKESAEAGLHVYTIFKGKWDKMTIKTHERFEGLTFRELLLLSAVYSHLESIGHEHNVRITLRSLYEWLHRGARWWDVKADKRQAFFQEFVNLRDKLNMLKGEYEWMRKDSQGRECKEKCVIDTDYFLQLDWVAKIKDFYEHGFRDAWLTFAVTPMFGVVMAQKCLTRLPDAYLGCPRNGFDYDGLKYYLAFRVVQSKDGWLQKSVKYSTIEEIFGDASRYVVKQYFDWLEKQGLVKDVKHDKDAVRWENVKGE